MRPNEIQYRLIQLAKSNEEVHAYRAAKKLNIGDKREDVNLLLDDLIKRGLLIGITDVNNTGEKVGMRNAATLKIQSRDDLKAMMLSLIHI